MSDAWMVRESERQEFLETLKRRVIDIDKWPYQDVCYSLARICLNFLQDETTEPADTIPDNLFFTEFLPAMSNFSRAEEERSILIIDLLSWLVKSIAIRYRSALTHKEMRDPHTIFHADSATTDI